MAKTQKEQRELLIEELLADWATWGPGYVTNIETYNVLLHIKREKNIPLNKIPRGVLKDYPVIPFLEIEKELEARIYLESLTKSSLIALKKEIEGLQLNHAYRTVRENIIDSRDQIRRYEKRKELGGRCATGIDPDRVSVGRHTSKKSGKF